MGAFKQVVSVASLIVVGLSVIGCQSASPAANAAAAAPAATPELASGGTGVIRADVTDIRPAEGAAASPAGLVMTPMYDSPPQPVTYAVATPATVAIPTIPMIAPSKVGSPTFAASAGTHTVRAGETLFSIARSSYGDGKQWRKIAAANPGLSPSSLRVGQAITIP